MEKKSLKEIDSIIIKQSAQLQADLRRAFFPFIILFYIKQRPHYQFEIQKKIASLSQAIASAEQQFNISKISVDKEAKINKNIIYNNLKKFEQKGIIDSFKKKSKLGAQRKYYYLTASGNKFFDELVLKRLFPRLSLFMSFMEEALQYDKQGFIQLQKEIKEFPIIFNFKNLLK